MTARRLKDNAIVSCRGRRQGENGFGNLIQEVRRYQRLKFCRVSRGTFDYEYRHNFRLRVEALLVKVDEFSDIAHRTVR
jgi:hypothetical protein